MKALDSVPHLMSRVRQPFHFAYGYAIALRPTSTAAGVDVIWCDCHEFTSPVTRVCSEMPFMLSRFAVIFCERFSTGLYFGGLGLING